MDIEMQTLYANLCDSGMNTYIAEVMYGKKMVQHSYDLSHLFIRM